MSRHIGGYSGAEARGHVIQLRDKTQREEQRRERETGEVKILYRGIKVSETTIGLMSRTDALQTGSD